MEKSSKNPRSAPLEFRWCGKPEICIDPQTGEEVEVNEGLLFRDGEPVAWMEYEKLFYNRELVPRIHKYNRLRKKEKRLLLEVIEQLVESLVVSDCDRYDEPAEKEEALN